MGLLLAKTAKLRSRHGMAGLPIALRLWLGNGWSSIRRLGLRADSDGIHRLLERDRFPGIGSRQISDLSAPELVMVARRIEDRGALDTAHRALGTCGQIFRYAVATQRCVRDPSGDLRGALPPVRGKHFA